jgi:uncharacterized protein (TIGR03435 family)
MRQLARTLAAGAALSLALVATSHTQAQVTSPSFEVASVKRSNPAPVGQRTTTRLPLPMPGGRWMAQNVSLRLILQAAYPAFSHHTRIIGPSWIDSERFDIDARTNAEPSSDQLLLMVRTLLAQRFSLKVHTETRPVAAYVLVRLRPDGRLGPGLRPPVPCRAGDGTTGFFADRVPRPGELPPCGVWTVTENGIRRTQAGDVPLRGLLPLLGAALFDRPLIDRTELTERFSIQLEVDVTPAPQAGVQPASTGTQLFTAVREQLGLAVEARREPLEVLVIDNVQLPSAN